MWKKSPIIILFLVICSSVFARTNETFCPAPQRCPLSGFRELPKEELQLKPQEPSGCRLINQEFPSAALRQQPMASQLGCLPAPKKICPSPPSACAHADPITTKPALLVCLLPSQSIPAKPSICTTTSIITGPCSINATRATTTSSCMVQPVLQPTTTTTTEKGIIPLVKALFSPKSANATTTSLETNNTTIEMKNNATFRCPTSIYPEPASIPPAVYEILSRIAKERT